MNELNTIDEMYESIKEKIEERIKAFQNIWISSTEKELFIELVFCILTPQSKARSAWSCVEKLLETNLLFIGSSQEIEPYVNKVRFSKRKALFIVMARNDFIDNKKYDLREILKSFPDIKDKREWLVKHVKGIGYKEASHFLRNIGFGKDLTILDRHILKNLVKYQVIKEVPKTLTKKAYHKIEEKMIEFALKNNIPLDHLDFIWWYAEAKDIFK